MNLVTLVFDHNDQNILIHRRDHDLFEVSGSIDVTFSMTNTVNYLVENTVLEDPSLKGMESSLTRVYNYLLSQLVITK